MLSTALLLSLLIALAACQGGPSKTFVKAETSDVTSPCWMTHPSPGKRVGAIGLSRTISTTLPPLALARIRAIQSLQGYLGEEEISAKVRQNVRQLPRSGGKIGYHNRTIHLAPPFDRAGYIYAWALVGEEALESSWQQPCPEQAAIEPEACRPDWICSPVQGEKVGVLGVSYRAATLPHQLELAVKNAITLLEYAYGAQVTGQQRFLRTSYSSLGGLRLRLSKFELTKKNSTNLTIRLYPKELRYSKEALYIWLVSPDLDPYPIPENRDWTRHPGSVEANGAVGIAHQTADGLLSSQIQSAFEKGILALAQKQGANIKTVEHLRLKPQGRYYLRDISSGVEAVVQARMRGFYPHPDGRVFVWVATP